MKIDVHLEPANASDPINSNWDSGLIVIEERDPVNTPPSCGVHP